MSDQIYFIGYRPEQFTGYDNTGSASYSAISATSTTEPNSLGMISLNTSGNVLWKELDIPNTDDVYMIGCLFSYNNGGYAYSVGSITITDGTNAIQIKSTAPGGSPITLITAYSGTYSSSSRFTSSSTLGSVSMPLSESSAGVTWRIYIKFGVSSGSYNTVSIQVTNTDSANISTLSTLFSGTLPLSLSNIKSMYSDYSSAQRVANAFYYCGFTNFDMTGGYIDYTTVASEGTFSDWTGTATTLNTYPINTSATANGLYSINSGDKVTFNPTKQLSTGSGMTIPKAVFIDSSLMVNQSGLDFEAVPISKNSNNNIIHQLGSAVQPGTSYTDYQWFSYQNPSTLTTWQASEINSIEFGLQRTQ